jgi:uncharacterized membrane-anchored protein YhcB (DUF1043 family)
MAVELVVGIALTSLLAGLGVGYFLAGGGSAKRARETQLEGALEAAQIELADYKRDVFGQFSETAEKFRALDKSYSELHRQLAESSVALCGDAATPLLEGPLAPALDVAEEEIVVAEVDPPVSAEDQEDVTIPTLTETETDAEELNPNMNSKKESA